MRALEICTLAVMLAVAGCDDAGTSTPTAPATPRSPAPTPAAEPVTASLSGDATLIERTPAATLAWLVEPSGKTTLAAKSAMCEPVGDVKGTLQFVDLASGSEKEVPLRAENGLWVAQGPPLTSELTQVKYSLTMGGQPIEGSLHVPKGGTESLAKSAPAASPDQSIAEEGGEIVQLGDDRFELVADEDTGVLKVFPRDTKAEPATVVLGIGGDRPAMIELERRETPTLHFAALLPTDGVRRTFTLAVKPAAGETRIALVGHRQNEARYVGPDAPRRRMWTRKGWTDDAKTLETSEKANARAKIAGEDGGDVTVCHRPQGNPDQAKTMTVGKAALQAHLDHGDTEGPCDAADEHADVEDELAKTNGKPHEKGKADEKGKGAEKKNDAPVQPAKGPPSNEAQGQPQNDGQGQGQPKGQGQGQGQGKGQ